MPSIYNYSDPTAYISDFLKEQKLQHENFTLKSWAEEVGFKSSAPLVEVLKGEKNLKMSLVALLLDKIGLDPSEYGYFLSLVLKSRSSHELEEKILDVFLNELSPKSSESFTTKRFENDDIFSHWIFTTILTMTDLKDFDMTAENIQRSLKEELPLNVIEDAIDRLLTLELLHMVDGKLCKKYDRVSTKTDTKHSSVANYFSQMADLSKKAIEVPLDQREFQSFSLSLPQEKMPMAKDIIRKCRNQLSALCDEGGNEVYQMNMFFFPLTDRKSGH